MQTQVTAEELGWSARPSTNSAKRKGGGLVSRSCMLGVTKMNVHEIVLSICAIISHTKNEIVFSDMLTQVPLESGRITGLHGRAEFGPESLVRTLCWNPAENRGFQRTMRIKLMQHTQRFTLTGAHRILSHSKISICKDKNLYKTNTP